MLEVHDGGAAARPALQRLRRLHQPVRPPLSLDFEVHRGRQPHPVLRVPGVDAHLPHLHHRRLRGLHELQPHQDPAAAAGPQVSMSRLFDHYATESPNCRNG